MYISKEKWSKVLDQLHEVGINKIACGDFNAHHSQWSVNENQVGLNLAEVLVETDYIPLNNKVSPTRISRPDCVSGSPDITLVSSNLVTMSTWGVGNDTYESDHLPIYINIGSCNHKVYTNRTKLNINKLNREKFCLEANTLAKDLRSKQLSSVELYNKFISVT